ncbi:LysR family transcriptional regulator [Pseudomonas sp. DY-1]|jgi:DNA-binding transcriptional LysR family regulator|uniref:LysR family transcriptional regulator n=1 Tax=unclassified Pseudomonas TaxID=196821 RepID=UPI000EA92D7B|nr:LysR family transcriptional regulator [Pseudomonas sp. DY-1]AYF87003.1 LysR family transcriptional regulator [Pseudomonas sp. DY-1]
MFNRIELLRILCVAAESPSFREAATRLGASPQTVTRAIKDLEDQFGEPLFHRSTRHVQITAFGERLVSQAREALAGLDQLFQQHGGKREEEMAGRVGIAAPRSVGRRFLLPVLAKIAREHPRIHFDMRLSDQLTDSVEQQIDLGVRIGFIRDRRYIARAVAQIPLLVVGAPELLQRHGAPGTVDELHHTPTTALIDNNTGRVWPWMFAEGRQIQPASAAFCTDDPENELEAVLAGFGFGQLPSYLVDPHIRAGHLKVVLQEQAPPPWEMFIYRPQQGPVSPRVRLVHDLLVEHLSDPTLVPQR